MDNLKRRYDPKQPLLEELRKKSDNLKEKSNELFLLLKEVINIETHKNTMSESIKNIDDLINYIETEKDTELAKKIKIVIKNRGLEGN